MKKISLIFLATFLFFVSQGVVNAYVSSSANYRMERDSINIGGVLSSSTNYREEDTIGEVGTGRLTSTNYILLAGYQQIDGSSISINSPADISLGSINNINGGSGEGTAVWVVTTDNSAGYTLSLLSSTNPAMQRTTGGASFDNYSTAGGTPDFTWSVTGAAEFGFTPEGTDIASRYLDNGVSCSTGTSNTQSACWDPLSASGVTIASRASQAASGATTTVRFRVEIQNKQNQPVGEYQSTVTATALAS